MIDRPMIGRPITSDEFGKVLERQRAKDDFVNHLMAELKAIKEGECLLYETKGRMEALAEMSFSFLVGKIGGLKMITEGNQTYIYREK